MFLFDPSDAFIGGFASQYYDGIIQGNTGYVTAIETFSQNANCSYFVQTYGGGSFFQGPIDHLTTFPEFQRQDHTGLLNGFDPASYRYLDNISYEAVRQ